MGLQVRENSGGKMIDHQGAVCEGDRKLVPQGGRGVNRRIV